MGGFGRNRSLLAVVGFVGLLAVVPAVWALTLMARPVQQNPVSTYSAPVPGPSSYSAAQSASPTYKAATPVVTLPPAATASLPPSALPPAQTTPQQPISPAAQQPVVCPSGVITDRLDSVAAEVTGGMYCKVMFRGTLSNGTTGDILLGSTEIPRIEGLDGGGNAMLGAVIGEFDQTPPPGKPKASELVLSPGQTIGFSGYINTYKGTIPVRKF